MVAWDAPNAACPIYSGKNRLSMNAFSGFGDHLDCERGPDGGFEATHVRGKVFCEDDGFRSERKLPADFVLNPERVLNVETAVLASVSECIGIATNNVAEYRGADRGAPGRARSSTPRCVPRPGRLRADDPPARRPLQGEERAPASRSTRRHARCWPSSTRWTSAHIRREKNVDADALVNAALDAVES